MIPAKKTTYSEITDDMFSSVIKSTSEFKIHSWKMKIEKIKAVNEFEYMLLTAILKAYLNKNDEAIDIAELMLLHTKNKDYQASIYRVIGNFHAHEGRFKQAIDAFWIAYELTHDPIYFDAFFITAASYDYYDPRLEETHGLNLEAREDLLIEINGLKNEINTFNKMDLSVELYQSILGSAFKVFFSHCSGKVVRFPDFSGDQINTILFNPDLDLETIGLLNDEMTNELVKLTEEYNFEDLLNYPIIFTTTDYSKTVGKDYYG